MHVGSHFGGHLGRTLGTARAAATFVPRPKQVRVLNGTTAVTVSAGPAVALARGANDVVLVEVGDG